MYMVRLDDKSFDFSENEPDSSMKASIYGRNSRYFEFQLRVNICDLENTAPAGTSAASKYGTDRLMRDLMGKRDCENFQPTAPEHTVAETGGGHQYLRQC
jgi:hypothetical protein